MKIAQQQNDQAVKMLIDMKVKGKDKNETKKCTLFQRNSIN